MDGRAEMAAAGFDRNCMDSNIPHRHGQGAGKVQSLQYAGYSYTSEQLLPFISDSAAGWLFIGSVTFVEGKYLKYAIAAGYGLLRGYCFLAWRQGGGLAASL